MLFKRKDDSERTPGEKARRAQLGILARLLGCAYLIYIVSQLLKKENIEKSNMGPTLTYIISGVFLIAAAVVIVITVFDWYRNWKMGRYSIHTYYKEELDQLGLEYNDNGELVPKGQGTGSKQAEDSEEEVSDGGEYDLDAPEDDGEESYHDIEDDESGSEPDDE